MRFGLPVLLCAKYKVKSSDCFFFLFFFFGGGGGGGGNECVRPFCLVDAAQIRFELDTSSFRGNRDEH